MIKVIVLYLSPILIASFFVLLFVFGIYELNEYQQNKKWNSLNIKKTIATVTDYEGGGVKGGGSSVATFYVRDSVYSRNIEISNIIGSKFIVEYNEVNPVENRIYREFPLFEIDEKTINVIGKLTRYNSSVLKSLEYEFFVEDKFYKHTQYEEKDTNDKYTNIKEGQLFMVKYWNKDFRRSIIHLDKPLEYISQWWKYKVDENGKIIK